MQDYTDFTVEQFVMDEHFQDWVKRPTPENILFWDRWLAQHPDKAEVIRQARLIILSMNFKKTSAHEIPRDPLLERIQASIREADSKSAQSRRAFGARYYKAAATFLGLLISAASLYLLVHSDSESYATGYGEISHITLPDGSSVVLNSNSAIHFENWESQAVREVWLTGEAFFNVIHTKDHEKFIVRTDQMDVEVLGTQFNVKERRNATQVVLNSGKVKLNKAGRKMDSVFMHPGEAVELSEDEKEFKKKLVDPGHFSAWTKKQLVFVATPLVQIAQTLEDNYGWKAYFENDSLKTYRFTGTISTESVADIELLLYTIAEAFDIEVTKVNKQLTFKKKR